MLYSDAEVSKIKTHIFLKKLKQVDKYWIMVSLTDILYWYQKQKHLHSIDIERAGTPEWLDVILPYLRKYEGGSFIEIGCSPGYVSAVICSNVRLVPYGIDFSPMAYLYLESMRRVGYLNATLYKGDIGTFRIDKCFDVVGSVGLVEHFTDPFEILDHHYRLTKPGGIVFVIIPNFRYVQWLYHFIFNRADLSFHYLETMKLEVFVKFSNNKGLDILFLDYCGKLRFWGVNVEGNKYIVYGRRIISRIIREVTNRFISKITPANSKYTSPWIVYVGFKKKMFSKQ